MSVIDLFISTDHYFTNIPKKGINFIIIAIDMISLGDFMKFLFKIHDN